MMDEGQLLVLVIFVSRCYTVGLVELLYNYIS